MRHARAPSSALQAAPHAHVLGASARVAARAPGNTTVSLDRWERPVWLAWLPSVNRRRSRRDHVQQLRLQNRRALKLGVHSPARGTTGCPHARQSWGTASVRGRGIPVPPFRGAGPSSEHLPNEACTSDTNLRRLCFQRIGHEHLCKRVARPVTESCEAPQFVSQGIPRRLRGSGSPSWPLPCRRWAVSERRRPTAHRPGTAERSGSAR